jgi:glucose-1-phosphate cytidylyltransferase
MSIKTIILCGGQGTRIRDVAHDIPKPMVTIGDRPVLWHIMKVYAHYSIKEFILCLGYRGWVIKEFFLNYRAFSTDISLTLGGKSAPEFDNGTEEDWHITLAETGIQTQTGGRIWRVRKYLKDSDLFCVTYGDGVADINLQKLIAFHKAHGRVGTVTGVRPPGRFGVMNTEQQSGFQVVYDFEEKPQTTQGWINGGFFVFDQRLWRYMNDDPGLIFEREPLSELARDGQLVMYEHSGFWQPMDTYREWKILNDLWDADEAPWRMW